MRRNQWAAVLLALVLFSSGVAVGALAHRFYSHGVVSAKTSEDVRQQYMAEMRSRLHLTPEQVTQLQEIMDETKAKARVVRERIHPEMVKIREEQIARVRSILTPDQMPAYEKFLAERHWTDRPGRP